VVFADQQLKDARALSIGPCEYKYDLATNIQPLRHCQLLKYLALNLIVCYPSKNTSLNSFKAYTLKVALSGELDVLCLAM